MVPGYFAVVYDVQYRYREYRISSVKMVFYFLQ
jgi:hypothetical protein